MRACDDEARMRTELPRLFVSMTIEAIHFAEGTFPVLAGTTGVQPLDIDGDEAFGFANLRICSNALLRGDGDCGFLGGTEEW